MFIIPVGTRHVYRPASPERKELIVYNCLFDLSVPERLVRSHALPEPLIELLAGDGAYRRYKDESGEARARMVTLHRELQERRPGFDVFMHACLTELLAILYRLPLREAVAAAPSRLDVVLRYIRENCVRPLTLPVSASHMQRLLRQATGQTFTEYVQNSRIDLSCQLLRDTGLSIRDVAARAGYRDMKFFYELFRRKTGLSPRRYRIEHRPPRT